jgi:glyoxylase I family protein
MVEQLTASETLTDVNLRIGEAEKAQELAYLNEHMHEDLVFRRADGKVATKKQYLDGVPGKKYDVLESQILQVEQATDSSVVTVVVRAEGITADGTRFHGSYRNTRVFVNESGRWLCKVWINSRVGLDIQGIHHVSLPVTDPERSKDFYREILGMREIERPPFKFPGVWLEVGGNQLHLIVDNDSTFRVAKAVNSHDIHFAVRVKSYRDALEFLNSKGYNEEASDLMEMKENREGTAGFPQIYILDPDRNVIEINAEKLDA